MYDLSPQAEEALHAQLEQVRARLENLERERHSVDCELEELQPERQQVELLHVVCGGLEKLDELGAAGLFWGSAGGEARGAEHLRSVRARVDDFHGHLRSIESTRQTLTEQIAAEQQGIALLEEDLFEAKLAEEERKQEWIVERELAALPSRPSVMPWARGGDDDVRFRKALAGSLLASLLLGALLPLIDLPLPESWEVAAVPERLTRLIREQQPLPPPPPREQPRPVEQEKLQPSEETPRVAEQTTPKPTPQPVPKQGAKSKGILAFRETFSGLADSRADARLGSQARIRRAGESASGRPQRALVATHAPGSSGGIDVASLSRDVGGGGQAIEGVAVARATSSIGSANGSDRPLSSGPGPARTDEEIQIVFDRHKAALYRLYNRELRRDPTLKGQMVLRFRIEPDGLVTLCELQSTDMDAPELAKQVVARVAAFDFGAKDGVGPITILYPIDFLPAT